MPASARSTSTIDSFTLNSVRGQEPSHDNTNVPPSHHRNTNFLTKQDNQLSYRQDTSDAVLHNSLGAGESINQDTSHLADEDVDYVTSSSKTFHPSSPTRTSSKNNSNRFTSEAAAHTQSGNASRGQKTPTLSPTTGQSPESPTPRSHRHHHHQPVDQNPLRSSVAEDYIESVNEAASKIQKWYRTTSKKRKEGESEIRRILNQKRMERELIMEREAREVETDQKKEMGRKRAREEKQRLARQAAIEVSSP